MLVKHWEKIGALTNLGKLCKGIEETLINYGCAANIHTCELKPIGSKFMWDSQYESIEVLGPKIMLVRGLMKFVPLLLTTPASKDLLSMKSQFQINLLISSMPSQYQALANVFSNPSWAMTRQKSTSMFPQYLIIINDFSSPISLRFCWELTDYLIKERELID